ncbi:unnamed protein product [Nesidiocoris tenuis]|uniref:AP-3 complex subunit beta C-terminal domain-containing protein n=1 Tax=Nesidiocoris tenuis TaxID=355587 RepID=A0A6H5GFI5_9HEMI|nr:unnamed protein product [Nesidiocoris tenuis]
MTNNGSYSNERSAGAGGGGDIDYASDPASGGFFNSDYKKHDDLKQMLDTNKDGLKLEAMKRIIGMIAKGRDASELFPAVVKNVVSKNIEVKKLVYVYLVRYAEEQQDLALLSISTFQRALKDPNQLIRASALRVLSSIRVTVIVPIVMLAIKDSASDMSPYVRKTAAHAIPKLYALDPEQKDELIHVIEKLLSDKTTLVVGSAVMAFEEVCPEKISLIHKNFRKLCNLLVDVDEWGQVIIINMLTRYARTQFVDPNKGISDCEDESEKPFYEDEEETENISKKATFTLDPDHRLLLKNAKPLLQSRNASVVMAVAQLFHHCAPRNEVSIIGKSLIRLLRSHREVQSVVLNCMAYISVLRKGMFEPYLKSFFVRTSDPTHIKLLKLDILTNLATETNIPVILREFQTYVSSPDKEFVAAAIQAIGRCASNIKEVTDTCLSGLVALLSNRDEAVVAESVVVIKKLLQSQPSRHKDIIQSMAKLLDTITVPAARASILWLLGEYSELVPTIAPDVLRKLAKSFINEEDIVKLQVLNLAVKLFLTNPAQTKLLCQYVFMLARYDQNYDVRDRSRFLKQFVFPSNPDNNLTAFSKQIFLASKPAPLLVSKFKDRDSYLMGSLSHYLNMRTTGYHDLPDFPDVAPDPTERNVPDMSPPSPVVVTPKKESKNGSFYSESDSSRNGEVGPALPVMTPSLGGFLSPLTPVISGAPVNSIQPVGPSYVPLKYNEIVSRIVGRGMSVNARFTRQAHLFSPKMLKIELKFTNHLEESFDDISMTYQKLPPGVKVHEFSPIGSLPAHGSAIGTIGVDWNDSTQPLNFNITWKDGSAAVTMKAPIGELIRAVKISHAMFIEEQGKKYLWCCDILKIFLRRTQRYHLSYYHFYRHTPCAHKT